MQCLKTHFKVINKIEDIVDSKVITAYNRTRYNVNQMLFKREHPNAKYPYFEGQILRCRKGTFDKKAKCYVNYEYTVININEKTVKLTDGDNEIILETKYLDTNFTYNYACTCHSAQGLTFDEPITICDVKSPMATGRWLNTAITRTTDLKNITICMNDLGDFYLVLHNTIKIKLEAHKKDDLLKNRQFDLDAEWVKGVLKKQDFQCKLCKCYLDIEGDNAINSVT